MPEPITADQQLTITHLMPWFAGVAGTAAALSVAVFKWIFQTALIDEIKSLKIEIRSLSSEFQQCKTEIAVLTRVVTMLEADTHEQQKKRG